MSCAGSFPIDALPPAVLLAGTYSVVSLARGRDETSAGAFTTNTGSLTLQQVHNGRVARVAGTAEGAALVPQADQGWSNFNRYPNRRKECP
jgi:hypothetical protein